jgi:hypothetical protein
MAEGEERKRFIVDRSRLPSGFPTHWHSSEFWETLGRTVATFGFLEQALGKAIFSFTTTREFPRSNWRPSTRNGLPQCNEPLAIRSAA